MKEVSPEEAAATLERVAQLFFLIDGMNSRTLMPYPHDPLRHASPWKKYDHLTVKDRLDQLYDVPQWEQVLFESNVNTFGSCPGRDTGFTEALRWFALGGHTMTGVFEMAGIHKPGNGGMSSFALAIKNEYTGDLLLNTAVTAITNCASGAEITTATGRKLMSKALISTIPLYVFQRNLYMDREEYTFVRV